MPQTLENTTEAKTLLSSLQAGLNIDVKTASLFEQLPKNDLLQGRFSLV